MPLILSRRRALLGMLGLVAAPAVIKAERLMRVVGPVTGRWDGVTYGRSPAMDVLPNIQEMHRLYQITWQEIPGALRYNICVADPRVGWLPHPAVRGRLGLVAAAAHAQPIPAVDSSPAQSLARD